MNWNQIFEDAIVGRLIAALIDHDFRIEISDNDGGGLYVYAAELAELNGKKPDEGYKFWVRLVPGNGSDIIVDYSVNLETVIKPALDFAAAFA